MAQNIERTHELCLYIPTKEQFELINKRLIGQDKYGRWGFLGTCMTCNPIEFKLWINSPDKEEVDTIMRRILDIAARFDLTISKQYYKDLVPSVVERHLVEFELIDLGTKSDEFDLKGRANEYRF